MGRIVRVGVLVAAACLTLAACSSGDEKVAPAPTLAPPSTSATPSPTGPTPPVMPAAVKVQNRAGAEAAFRYWLETYTYGFATGDTTPMQTIITKDCGFCQDIVKEIDGMRKSGEHFIGGRDVVTSLVSVPFEGDYSYLMRVVITQTGTVLVDGQGKKRGTSAPAKAISLDVKALWTTSHWKIDRAAVAKR